MTHCLTGRRAYRRGVTLIELLIVFVLIATLAGIAAPSAAGLRGSQGVRGARGEVVATIEAARAAALQRGLPARVVRRDDVLVAVAEDGSAKGYTVVASADLWLDYQVTLRTAVPADDSITFDGRGLASPRLGRAMARYVVRARQTGQRDSVCVSNLGLLLPPRCVR